MRENANMIKQWVFKNELEKAVAQAMTDKGLKVEIDRTDRMVWVWGTCIEGNYYAQFAVIFYKGNIDSIGLTLETQRDMITYLNSFGGHRYHKYAHTEDIRWQDIVDCISVM